MDIRYLNRTEPNRMNKWTLEISLLKIDQLVIMMMMDITNCFVCLALVLCDLIEFSLHYITSASTCLLI